MRSIKKLSVLLCLCMILLFIQSALAVDEFEVIVQEGATTVSIPLGVTTKFDEFAGVGFTVKTSAGVEYKSLIWSDIIKLSSDIKIDNYKDKNGDYYIAAGVHENAYIPDSNHYAEIANLTFDYIGNIDETIEIVNLQVSRFIDPQTTETETFNSIKFNITRFDKDAAVLSFIGPASVVSSPGATATYALSVENMPTVAGIGLEFEISDDFLSYLTYSGSNSPSRFSFFTSGNNSTPIFWTDNNDGTWKGVVTLISPNVAGSFGDMELMYFNFDVKPNVTGIIDFTLKAVNLSYAGNSISSRIDQNANNVTTTFIDPASVTTPAPTPTPPAPPPPSTPTPPKNSGGFPGDPGKPSDGNTPSITGNPPEDELEEDIDEGADIDDEDDPGLPGGPADVDKLVYIPFINGYPDGTVQPDGMLTRAELAQILYNLHGSGDSYAPDYIDVAPDHWAYNAIGFCQGNNYMIGYPEGDFQPDATVTRAEICTTLVRLVGLDLSSSHPFPDVAGHWSNDYVGAAYAGGLVTGYPDGTFRPDDNVTRAEAVTMICRAEGRDESLFDLYKIFPDLVASYWGYEFVMNAANGYNYYDMG